MAIGGLAVCQAQDLYDGETHPFLNGQGTGGDPGPGFTAKNTATIREILSFLESIDATNPPAGTRGKLTQLGNILKPVSGLSFSQIEPATPITVEVIERAEKAAQAALTAQYRHTQFISPQLGYLSASDSKIGFISVLLGSQEDGIRGSDHSAFGVSATALPIFHSGSTPVAWRFAGYSLSGNPDSFVTTISAGSYVNPSVYDASIHASALLFEVETHGENSAAATRYLLDHIRAGDVWFDAEFRVLANQVMGQSVETGLTYGIPNYSVKGHAASITAAVTYCEQANLKLNEGSIELRLPTSLLQTKNPTYITGRYGTRGDVSIGIAVRF